MLENTQVFFISLTRHLQKNYFYILVLTVIIIFAGCSSPTTPTIPTDSDSQSSFSIIYHANGADSGTVPGTQQKEEGLSIDLADNTGNLAKSDYLFLRWNTEPDGSGVDYEGGDIYTDDADLNLYAKWRDTAFVTKWTGDYTDKSITIPTDSSYIYNYNIDWGDGTSESGLTGDATHTYASSMVEYTVKITGTFPAINFSSSSYTNRYNIHSVVNWGTIEWKSMNHAFYSCPNFKTIAEDAPDLSQVTDLSYMFYDAAIFEDFSSWDVSNITNMSAMFKEAYFFIEPGLENWNVSNVTNMASMFESSLKFDEDLSKWDVSKVTNFAAMLYGVSSFTDHDLSSWDVDYSDDDRTVIYHNYFSRNWGSGNIEPNWID